MTGILRYIYCMIGLILILNVSCNDNDKIQSNDKNGREEVVEFILLSSPNTYAQTDAGSISERTIKEVDILVFKNDKYQYRKEATPNGTSYRASLAVDEGLTLYLIINNRALLESSDQLIEGRSWNTEVRPSLIMKDPVGLIGSTALPMWAVKENVTIIEGELNQLTDIHLLRAVASVDIYNGENPSTFALKEAWLYFAPDQGYIAPSASNYVPAEKGVIVPEAPAAMQNYASPLGVTSAEDEKILYQLYLYENDAVSAAAGEKRYTRVVIGGSFEGGATTYYPVDLLENNLRDILQATRNYKYIVSIAKVSSPGYPDPGTASEAQDSRLETDVIEWNLKDEQELVFNGPHYISLESKQVYLYKPAGSTRTLSMTTSIPTSQIKMEMPDSGNGEGQRSGYIIQNNRFKAEILFDENNEIEAIKITALGSYDPSNPDRNKQVLKIYSSQVEITIDIEQVNEAPINWIDGGNTNIVMGEEDNSDGNSEEEGNENEEEGSETE